MKTRSRKADTGITVGTHKDAGRYPKGQHVAQVGKWNAEGTGRIPPRHYLKKLIKVYRRDYKKMMCALMANMLKGRFDVHKAQRNAGTRAVKNLKAIITGWRLPRNADSTMARKGKDDPLIHTKRLLRTINWKPL